MAFHWKKIAQQRQNPSFKLGEYLNQGNEESQLNLNFLPLYFGKSNSSSGQYIFSKRSLISVGDKFFTLEKYVPTSNLDTLIEGATRPVSDFKTLELAYLEGFLKKEKWDGSEELVLVSVAIVFWFNTVDVEIINDDDIAIDDDIEDDDDIADDIVIAVDEVLEDDVVIADDNEDADVDVIIDDVASDSSTTSSSMIDDDGKEDAFLKDGSETLTVGATTSIGGFSFVRLKTFERRKKIYFNRSKFVRSKYGKK